MEQEECRNKYGLTVKFSLGILTSVAVISLIILIYNYHISEDIITDNIKDNSRNLTTSFINEINTYLSTVQQFSQDIANVVELCSLNQEDTGKLIENLVQNCKEIYGCTIAFEPYMFEKGKHSFARYFYKSNDKIKCLNPVPETYNYLASEWYVTPKKSNKGLWSEPYFDEENSDLFLAKYSVPFFRTIDGKRTFSGVVACNIDLALLRKLINNTKIPNTGYAFVLSSKGIFIEHINDEYTKLKRGIFSLAETRGDFNLKEIGEKMTSMKIGDAEYYSYTLGKKSFVFFEPIKKTGWSIGLVIPEDEPFSDLYNVLWRLFMIGASGYILILILIIMTISGFLWVSFHVTDSSRRT